MTERRFPPPWSVEEQAACFVVRDHNRQTALSGPLFGAGVRLITREVCMREVCMSDPARVQGLTPGPFPPPQLLTLPLLRIGSSC
jgi:hypothetical protein